MNLPERADQYNLDHWNENTNILDQQIQNIKDLNDDTLKASLLNFCYPIGSIYWSGVATNPHDLFGGTWEQIKDKFIWAKGDNDTVNATGGSKTVTLTEQQIPSHTHKVTASGTIGNTTATGTVSKHTHSVGAHAHGLNSHTHTLSGTLTTKNTINTANTNAKTLTGVFAGDYVRSVTTNASGIVSQAWQSDNNLQGGAAVNTVYKYTIDATHRHQVDLSGSTGQASGSTANSTAFNSGETQPTFTGTAHNHTFTGSEVTSVATGGGQAHDNMPPYIVKYCWERTA